MGESLSRKGVEVAIVDADFISACKKAEAALDATVEVFKWAQDGKINFSVFRIAIDELEGSHREALNEIIKLGDGFGLGLAQLIVAVRRVREAL